MLSLQNIVDGAIDGRCNRLQASCVDEQGSHFERDIEAQVQNHCVNKMDFFIFLFSVTVMYNFGLKVITIQYAVDLFPR